MILVISELLTLKSLLEDPYSAENRLWNHTFYNAGQPQPRGGEDAAGFHPAEGPRQAGDPLPQQKEVHLLQDSQRR